MNELKSYTEYAVSTPTADFVIGFDFNYGEDAVNVTVDNVPATEAGYTVVYLNETTIRLSPSVPSGVVRLQRETDIDQTDHAYRAGAKFIAQTMDENFEQLRHAQQEVRDGFSKLSTDTNRIIDGLDAALELAQDAAQDAQDAAVIAQGAADTVNTIIVGGKVSATNVLDASAETQQQVNYNGGSKWHSRVGGYKLNERVVLTNGDIVKSTIDGNTNDPNSNMAGWRFDDNTVESIADLLAIQNPKDGQVVYVKKTDSHFIFDGVWQPNIVNEINLAAFPRLSSEVDDTGRFLRASESIKQIQAISPPSGTASVTTTHLYIPFGEYFISDSITLNPYVHVISDDMPTIKQTTVGKDIFVFNESFSNVVRGIRFFNGRYSIVFKNSNIDQTVLMVDGCEFHRSESYAIHTIGLTESQHMSALLNITGCKFSLCNKILHNVCDKTVLSKSWAYLFFGNFDADSASIMNRYGRLDIEHLLGVPWLGSPNPFWGGGTRLVNTRWIDNYSILDCFKCRFGLESDGLTVVHSFGGADDLGNGMGSTITLRSCQVSGGDAQWLPASETGVIRIRAKMPRKIVIDDCNYQLNSPAITLSENYDFLSYLRTLVSDQSKLGQYLKDNIIISINNNERVLLDGMKNVPDVLAQFVNQGMDLQAHKVAVTATGTYVSYNLPVGANGALYEFMISGNTNPSGSKLYSYSTRYNLMIGTGYGNSGVVFYVQGAKVPQGDVPPTITIAGENLSIEPFFGDSVTGSDTLENNGIAAVRYVTLKISNSKEVKVSANLVSIH